MGSVNLVVFDRSGDLLEYIFTKRLDNVIVYIYEKNQKTINLIEQYKKNIFYSIDYNLLLEIQNVQYIQYDLIEKMRSSQIDIETMLHRIMLNNPLAKDIYHQHLSFFADIFRTHKIDLMISTETDLTSPNHHIPFSLCNLLGIPCYALNWYHYTAAALANYNNLKAQRHIPFTQTTLNADAQKIAYYKYETKKKKNTKKLRYLLKSLVMKIGGEMLSQFLVCCLKFNFQQNRLGIPYSYWTKLYYFLKYKQLQRFYKKISTIPNLQEKYIYYSIHFEPEAAIIGKTLLESQITIIKMLSKSLPKGWKLYVKEHPHQFMLNNEVSHYFINNLDFFKNISFYKEIQKLPNVIIVSLNISSKDLMLNSRAVATLGGTITLESALHKIPAILFNPYETVYGVLENTLHVRSYTDLLEAIEKLQNGFAQSIKPDLEKFNSYLADPRDPKFYDNLFITIEEHAKTIYPTGETL